MVQVFRASLEWRSPHSIKPYHRNNKNHPQAAVEKLAEHIQAYGWDVPIVVDADGVVIKGHRRRLVALHLKLEEVPVIVRTDLSEEQLAAARLADNRLNDDSPYDEAAIAEELAWLQGRGLDLSDTAFNGEEIGFLLDSLSNLATEGEAQEYDDEQQEQQPPQRPTFQPRYEQEEEQQGEPEAQQEQPRPSNGSSYPLAIVVSWSDRQRWQELKAALDCKKDPQAFLELLHLAELVQGEHPETWAAICKLRA